MAWYEDICVIILSQQRDGRRYPESASWNDILSVDNSLLCSGSGFAGYITCKLGDNTSIPFWMTTWTGSVNLSNRFPELFRVSNSKAMWWPAWSLVLGRTWN